MLYRQIFYILNSLEYSYSLPSYLKAYDLQPFPLQLHPYLESPIDVILAMDGQKSPSAVT